MLKSIHSIIHKKITPKILIVINTYLVFSLYEISS